MQPSTSSGLRPPSTLSSYRPPSSASTRPISRLSTHSHARHARSRLIPFAQKLVKQVTSLNESGDAAETSDFREMVELVVKNLETTTLSKGAVTVDMSVIDRQIGGHALKARVNSQDELGQALETCYQDLKTHIEKENDLDQEIQRSHLPDHLQFLIKLSAVPTQTTHHHASSYLYKRTHPPAPPAPLTWAAIVAEEPFEGEHWEGVYGLPPGFVRRPQNDAEGGRKYYDKEKERERLDWDSRWSTPSLSPLNSGDLELDEDQEGDESFEESVLSTSEAEPDTALGAKSFLEKNGANRKPPHTYAHRREFEALQEKQYWREGWRGDFPGVKPFDIKDASTLGPTLNTILHPNNVTKAMFGPLDALIQNEKYINEEDMVREVLIALQGRKNIILEWTISDKNKEGIYTLTQSAPRLLHLSLGSQASIITSLGRIATTIQLLRHFVARIFEDVQNQHVRPQPQDFRAGTRKTGTTRTREAFADAIDEEIRVLDKWCAAREEAMCRAWSGGINDSSLNNTDQSLVISLLGMEKDVRDVFEQTFDILLDVVREVYPMTTTRRYKSAAAVSSALLDRLFESIQAHLERQERVTSDALMRVFVRTVEPIWAMMGKWLKDGMGVGIGIESGKEESVRGLDEEFFIESKGLGLGIVGRGLLDPDFWKEGYTLKEDVVFEPVEGIDGGEEKRYKPIPLFLEHIAELVLGAGKAIGLLRALGMPLSTITSAKESTGWRSFQETVMPSVSSPSTTQGAIVEDGEKNNGGMLFSVSIDALSRMVYDRLSPQCEAAGLLLAHVLVEECALWKHLESIEDLFLMRRGDAMSHFTDVLFTKMDTQQPWDDFHFLNTAFRDVVEASTNVGAKEWVQTSLVRLSYRVTKGKAKAATRTVKAIDGLTMEYDVPFPLTYIFQPQTLQIYGEIFVFLLQIYRAKGVLERMFITGGTRGNNLKNETKAFYAMRSRLSWFINTLLNFLTTYVCPKVIHAQVLKFHNSFREAKSLDEMVRLHDNHLEKIQGRCLLKPNVTSSLHRAILSILDMALHFTDFFIASSGNTTSIYDTSRQSLSTRRHRSRRQRRQRRNVIGFSLSFVQDSSDEDEEEINDDNVPDLSFSLASSVSYTEEGFGDRIDKMTTELDGLVRFLRRGAETLAGGGGEAAPAFGVLAFALEDWDS